MSRAKTARAIKPVETDFAPSGQAAHLGCYPAEITGAFLNISKQLKASKAVGAKNYDLAIEQYIKILESNQKDQFALTMLAHCYEQKGDKVNALNYASRVLDQDPRDFEMLLLSARFWSELGDEERSYNYACRVIENAQEFTPAPPTWLLRLLKPLSIFKKFRGIENKAKIDWSNHANYKKDSVKWAKKYKEWYELKHSNG
jgi:tetratricopeptide (TPR) repeat protein